MNFNFFTPSKALPSKTLCVHRWNYLVVNLQTAHYRTCCLTPKQRIQSQDLKSYGEDFFLNSPYLLKRRKEMMLGEDHPDCRPCSSLEQKGLLSKRTTTVEFKKFLAGSGKVLAEQSDINLDRIYKKSKNKDLLLKERSPKTIEIVLGNHCDMKCTYCNHLYSSQWALEKIKHGDLTKEQYNLEFPSAPENFEAIFWSWLKKVDKSQLKHITLLGGEPILNPNFSHTVQQLVSLFDDSKQRPELGIVTNFNAEPKVFEKFLGQIEELSKYFYIHLQPSIEAMGERAEYIRYNLKWDRFEANIHQILSRKKQLGLNRDNFFMTIMPALNSMSFSSLPDLFRWIRCLCEEYNTVIGVGTNIVTDPFIHDPTILTSDFVRYAKEALEIVNNSMVAIEQGKDRHRLYHSEWRYYASKILEPLIKHYESKKDTKQKIHSEFIDFIAKNDKRRGCNFLQTFPEYSHFIEFCKT